MSWNKIVVVFVLPGESTSKAKVQLTHGDSNYCPLSTLLQLLLVDVLWEGKFSAGA